MHSLCKPGQRRLRRTPFCADARADVRSHIRPSLRALASAAALLMGSAGPVSAAVFNFTGITSGAWNLAANWAEGLPTSAADTELVLDAAARATTFNDIAGGLTLRGLTLGASAATPLLTGQALSFQGPGAYLRMLSNGGSGQVQTPLVLGSLLNVAGGPSLNSQLFFQGAISGTGGLQLSSGRLVMNNGSNSYTGPTLVDAGAVLGAGSQALRNHTSVLVAPGGELQLVGAGNTNPQAVVGAPIQLGGLLSSSARKVAFLGTPVSGALVSSAVTLSADARILAFGASGSGFNATEFTLQGPVNRDGHTLTLQTGGVNNSLLLSATLLGHGDLLLQANGGVIGIGAVQGNGAIRATGSGGTVSVSALSGNGVLEVAFAASSFGQLTTTGIVSGSRDVRVSSGTLNLGNLAHSFGGAVVMAGTGTLRATDESRLGAAANTLRFEQGGALDLTSAGAALSRPIFTTGGSGAIFVGANNSRTVSSTISGDGGIGFVNFGVRSSVTLTANNSFSGGLAIGDGVLLSFANDGNLGAAGGAIALGGILSMPASYTLNRALELSGNNASLSAAQAGVYTVQADVSGSGRLNLGGAAPGTVFVLAGANNSFSGGVRVAGNAGTDTAVLLIDSDARLGAPTGALDLGRANGVLAPLPATLRAAADLDIAATRSTSFRAMTVDTNGHTVVFNQPISGLGITKTGLGTWVLNTANSNNSNSHEVRVEQGLMRLGVDEALGTRSNLSVSAGAVLDLANRRLTVADTVTEAGGTVHLGSSGSGRLDTLFGSLQGDISGVGTLVVGRNGFSPGDVTLAGANSFMGGIEVGHGGRLTLAHPQALGAAGNALLLDKGGLSSSAALPGPLLIDSALNLQIGAGGASFHAQGQSIVIERQLIGNSPLAFLGGSQPGDSGPKVDVRLANAANSFVGDLVIGDARGFGSAALGLTADGALGAASNRITLGNSHFDGESTRTASGGLRAWDTLTLPGSRVVQLDGQANSTSAWIDTNGHNITLQAGITQLQTGMGLLKVGEGTLLLNGVNSYTGPTTVSEGVLGGHGEVEELQIGAAVLAPGASAGLLRVRGSVSFSGGGQLWMELGGLQRGTGYDGLDVGGSVDLGSDTVLRLDFIEGFEALVQGDQQFQLLLPGVNVFGQFANVASDGRLFTSDGSGSFAVHYGPGFGLLLDGYAAAVPEPADYWLWAAGLLGLGAWMRRRPAHVTVA